MKRDDMCVNAEVGFASKARFAQDLQRPGSWPHGAPRVRRHELLPGGLAMRWGQFWWIRVGQGNREFNGRKRLEGTRVQ